MARPTRSHPRCSMSWVPRWLRLAARQTDSTSTTKWAQPTRRRSWTQSGRTRPTTAWHWTATPIVLQLVDADGRLYNGDELLYLMVADRIARDEDVPGCVGTLMTNMAVEVALKARGVQFVRAKVGDRYVLEELTQRRWILGGEGSGHLLALDKHTTGDGLVSALQVLQACVGSGKTMAELLADVTLVPADPAQRAPASRSRTGRSNARLADETRAVEAELGDSGRVADPRQRHRAPVARDGRSARRRTGQGLRRATGRGGQCRIGALKQLGSGHQFVGARNHATDTEQPESCDRPGCQLRAGFRWQNQQGLQGPS